MCELNRLRKYMISVLTGLLISVYMLEASAAKPPPEIAEFAKCSRQCVTEQQQCRKKLETKCKGAGEACFESCDIAYPTCMAKCPKPGS